MRKITATQSGVDCENEMQNFSYNTYARNYKKIGTSEQSHMLSEITNSTVLKAIHNKDVNKVKKHLDELKRFYAKYISKDSGAGFLRSIPHLQSGTTLLHEAVRAIRMDRNIESFTSRSLEIAHIIILSGANVNDQNNLLETPLLIAIEGLLLSADPKMFYIHEKLISLLKEAGAVVGIQAEENAYSLPVRTVSVERKPPGVDHFEEQPSLRHIVLGSAFYFGETKTPRLLDAVAVSDPEAASEALASGEDASAKIIPSMLTALHLAIWVDCWEMVKLLLGVRGVDPCAADHFGLTPLLMAAAFGHESCLAELLEAGAKPNQVVTPEFTWEQHPSVRVDYQINMPLPICQGTTALHEAVKSNNPKCVELLLQYGADPEAWDKLKNTPLLLAGAVLKKDGKEGAIARFASSHAKASRNPSFPSIRKFSLSNISESTPTDSAFESTCSVSFPEEDEEHGRVAPALVANYERIAFALVDRMKDVNHFNKVSSSALLSAVSLGSEVVSKKLLEKGADPSKGNKYGSTPVHEAASRGHVKLLKRFVHYVAAKDLGSSEAFPGVINSRDVNGNTPVHRAAYGGHRACTSFLIESGANLSLRNVHGLSGIEAILLHIHRSRSFMTSLLDSRVNCKRAHKWEGDFALELDFAVLSPRGDVSQTTVMNCLLSSTVLPKGTQRDILEHPLVEAFYRLKWHKAKVSFFIVIAVHVIFVATLSAFVTLEYINYTSDQYLRKIAYLIRYFHLVFAALVLANAIVPCFLHFTYYSRKFETWILGVSALLSALWTLTGLENSPKLLSIVSSSDAGKIVLSFILPLAWTALMLMVGRFRAWGSRALLFGVVLRNVLVTFLVLGLLIIGLSLSFFVLFHSTRPDEFGDPWRSFVNTVVMMTGEYNYSETFKGANFYDRLLFLVFVVVATLVIMNLVIALAVTDAQSLSTEGEWLCLKKKMEFSDALESILPRIVARCDLPRKMKFIVNGSEDSGYRIKNGALPSRLVDALMESALRYKAEKPSLTKAAGDVVITFPEAEDCSLELHILEAEENRVNGILRSLYSRVGSSIREFVVSSKALPNLGSKVFWVKRTSRKNRSK